MAVELARGVSLELPGQDENFVKEQGILQLQKKIDAERGSFLRSFNLSKS